MKISVIMVDGGFRENVYSASYFSNQQFSDYELIWVDYYDKINPEVLQIPQVRAIALNREGKYHSSYCFNRGITEATGEVIVIPDADQVVDRDFLATIWRSHLAYDKLVVYGYRYDEIEPGALASRDLAELKKKCKVKNPTNYGGCLSVKKKWLMKINGYEQHPIFGGGFHANGKDLYTRFKNIGLAVEWNPELRIYHPWHPYTLHNSPELDAQKKFIGWRRSNLQWKALDGIDPTRNDLPPDEVLFELDKHLKNIDLYYRRPRTYLMMRSFEYLLQNLGRAERAIKRSVKPIG